MFATSLQRDVIPSGSKTYQKDVSTGINFASFGNRMMKTISTGKYPLESFSQTFVRFLTKDMLYALVTIGGKNLTVICCAVHTVVKIEGYRDDE